MFKPKLRRLPLAVAALTACASAHAGYSSPDGAFTLSGFGTLSAVKTSTKDAKYNYPGQGTGVDTTPGISPDTKLAVQGTYKFTPTFSGTVQVMTKTRAQGDFQPDIEWGFAKWQALPSLAVRVGVMGAPYYMVSDFREVGYAHTAVRPSLDVYSQVSATQFEGFDVAHQANIGSMTLTSSLWYGENKTDFALASPTVTPPTKVIIKNQLGLNFLSELDNGLAMRLGVARGKLSLNSSAGKSLQALASGLLTATAGATAAPGVNAYRSALSDTNTVLNVKDANAMFSGIGMTYDQDNWIVSAEYTKRTTDSYVVDSKGWYLNAGYRIGKFTPFVGLAKLTTAEVQANTVASAPAAIAGATIPVPPFPSSTIGGTTAILQGGMTSLLNTQRASEKTASLGVRWDGISGVALKTQWDRVFVPAGSKGSFMSPTASFLNESKKVDVLTISADFVF